jgi:hypothetical protein
MVVSYVDAPGERKKRKVAAHTRQQAMTILSNIRVIVGTKWPSDVLVGVRWGYF